MAKVNTRNTFESNLINPNQGQMLSIFREIARTTENKEFPPVATFGQNVCKIAYVTFVSRDVDVDGECKVVLLPVMADVDVVIDKPSQAEIAEADALTEQHEMLYDMLSDGSITKGAFDMLWPDEKQNRWIYLDDKIESNGKTKRISVDAYDEDWDELAQIVIRTCKG